MNDDKLADNLKVAQVKKQKQENMKNAMSKL
jgi:hypothetical protein